MAIHGTNARFYYHNMDYSPYAEEVAVDLERSYGEYRPLTSAGVRRVAGLQTARIALSGGPLETANQEKLWDAFTDETPRVWAFLPVGDAIGSPAICRASLEDAQQQVAGDDVVRLPFSMMSDRDFRFSRVLRNLSSGGTSPGPTYDGGQETTNGGTAYLICTAVSSTLTVTVQHSDNGTNWNNLVTMTAQAAPGSEAKSVSGTVRRYLRVSWTGSGSWFLAFARH